MKRISIILLAMIVTTTAAIISCKKTNNTTTPVTTAVFSSLRSTPQTLSVIAGRDTTVYAANGTMLHFYPNSFKNSTGNIITSGTINIQIREMYKPGDMALNGATTTADVGQLSSGGQVVISAYLGTQEVTANKYGIGFKQAGASTQPMQLFYGTTNNNDSMATWTISDTTKTGTTSNGTVTDSTGGGTGSGVNFMYIFDSCTNFGWVNCDHFSGSTYTLTNISVVMPDNSYTPANTEVFLIFPTDNSVMQLDAYSSANLSFSYITNRIPEGLNYEIVVVTNKNQSYYYWSGTGTITAHMSLNAAPASETLADIISRMHGL